MNNWIHADSKQRDTIRANEREGNKKFALNQQKDTEKYMVIKAEAVRGEAYILTGPGEVWRVRFDDRQPIIERLDDIGHDRARYLCETPFAKWAND